MHEEIIRLKQLQSVIGLSRVTIWRMVRAGKFPPPIPLTETAKGWRRCDVDQWIADRAEQSVAGGVP